MVALDIYNALINKPIIQIIYVNIIGLFLSKSKLGICVSFVDTKAISGLKNGKISLHKAHVRQYLHTASFSHSGEAKTQCFHNPSKRPQKEM